jgi:hypothetical protein
MNSTLKRVWQTRWEALDSSIAEMIAGMQLPSIPPIPRRDTLQVLLEGLRAAGALHFNWFLAGFFPEGRRPYSFQDDKKNGVKGHTSDSALRLVLDRIAFDLSIIQQCLAQRNGGTGLPGGLATLELADKYALKALGLAKTKGLIPAETTALTYLQKSLMARVIPYANVAMVGIPLTALRLNQDFLAIPHEVGHYVYWYKSDRLKDSIAEKLSPLLVQLHAPVQGWAEEVFADVYGCLVAGPVMALNFQDLLNQIHRDHFEPVAGEKHPYPIIRPYIYLYVLQKAGIAPSLIDQLKSNWLKILEDRGYNHPTRIPSNVKITGTLEDILPEDLRKLIDAILDLLGAAINIANVPLEQEKLYEHFEAYLKQLSVEDLPMLEGEVVDLSRIFTETEVFYPMLLKEERTYTIQFPPNLTSIRVLPDELISNLSTSLQEIPDLPNFSQEIPDLPNSLGEIPDPSDLFVSSEKWLEKLSGEGWTTEGPHGRT